MTVTLQLRVVEACELNPLIRMFVLRPDHGGALPGYSAGAHIRIDVVIGIITNITAITTARIRRHVVDSCVPRARRCQT